MTLQLFGHEDECPDHKKTGLASYLFEMVRTPLTELFRGQEHVVGVSTRAGPEFQIVLADRALEGNTGTEQTKDKVM